MHKEALTKSYARHPEVLFMKNIRIGHASQLYPEQRNIINKVQQAEYFLLHDAFWGLKKIRNISGASWLLPKKAKDAEFKFCDFNVNRVDLIHLFNTVSFSSTPWVSTFETIIPRFKVALACRDSNPERIRNDPEVLSALEALSSDSCKNIIAISQATEIMQNNFLDLFPEYKKAITLKQTVIHPPQPVMIEHAKNYKSFDALNPIKLLLVGHQFFRKGGREILDALTHIRKTTNFPISLTIISKLGTDDYATCTTKNDVLFIKQFISDNRNWITYHPELPHPEVVNLMKQCDIGLLPSYAETYGYSILEFQACGCPVITTDIRAFPEINNNDIGWLIPIPKRPDGEARYREPGGKEKIFDAITNGINRILSEIINDEEIIATKGRKALERIKLEHCPNKYEEKLLEIYNRALNS